KFGRLLAQLLAVSPERVEVRPKQREIEFPIRAAGADGGTRPANADAHITEFFQTRADFLNDLGLRVVAFPGFPGRPLQQPAKAEHALIVRREPDVSAD